MLAHDYTDLRTSAVVIPVATVPDPGSRRPDEAPGRRPEGGPTAFDPGPGRTYSRGIELGATVLQDRPDDSVLTRR